MEGFKNHYIDGKLWDRSANMKHKIHKFTRDGKENRVLNKILDYNKGKYREKLVLRRTSKYELLKLLGAKGASDIVKTKIENILNLSSRPKKRVGRNIEKISRKDLKLFAALVKAETLGEPYMGKVAVAYTILNRMKKSGKSLRKVIYAKTRKGKAEFSPVDNGRLNKMKKRLTQSDYNLVKAILQGKIRNPIGNAIFFQNKYIERHRNTWQERAERKGKLRKIATIGNHIFRAIA